jgi:2-succinyl-5-enolpyruvyl-6-hydroxy-3-cyclohexene-1-carboxylate synthase
LAIKTSSQLNAFYIAQLLKQHKCTNVVIAPGSRNAPLIIALTQDGSYQCTSVVDERAAAFTALGMSLQNKQPVAVICSSGSAAVNFYPAIVEAFYQKLPLVVITADRPRELIDQAVGQTIRQEGVFKNHILFEANLLRGNDDHLAKAYNQRLINEAMHHAYMGPVHINVPFDEPLYDWAQYQPEEVKFIQKPRMYKSIPAEELHAMAALWDASPKILVLIGQHTPTPGLNEAMNALNDYSPFLVMSETLSNIDTACNIYAIDRFINTLSADQLELFAPDLLITIGDEVVSKMIKKYFAGHAPKMHWHLGEDHLLKDTFGRLTHHLEADPERFFTDLKEYVSGGEAHYRDFMVELDANKSEAHNAYLQNAPFSDFQAFGHILDHLPDGSILHTANSTSVRYSQLFDHQHNEVLHYANRGTSGIDGCTSTAIGHAMQTQKMVTLISGDVAFLYDSNAFWNSNLPANFRVIILNNGGGNIFRIIKGPVHNQSFETFQETVHNLNLKGVAEVYDLEFASVDKEDDLKQALKEFFGPSKKARILEVKTPRLDNPNVLKEYFEFIRAKNDNHA